MQNIVQIVTAVAIGLVIGRWAGLAVVLTTMTGALLIGLVLRIVAHEQNRAIGAAARIAVTVGIATLAGRLMGWFGIIGGLLALVLIGVALIMAGADIA